MKLDIDSVLDKLADFFVNLSVAGFAVAIFQHSDKAANLAFGCLMCGIIFASQKKGK